MAWTWTQLSPATSPDPRAGFGFAYDKGRQYSLLIGGYSSPVSSPSTFYTDTWMWDGTTWTDMAPSTTPTGIMSDIALPTLVWDDANQTIMLYYYSGPGPYVFRTYLWDGTDWDEQSPATEPPVTGSLPPNWLSGASEAPGIGNVIIFGGNGPAGNGGSETWSWNGSTWAQLSPATTPAIRYLPFMAYDYDRNKVVMYGGRYSGSLERYDTYTWDGTDWTLKTTTIASTDSGNGRSMTYTTLCSEAVRFGGEITNNGNLTWLWNDTDWSGELPSPTPVHNLASDTQLLVYDEARTQVVLFGGYVVAGTVLGETWVGTCDDAGGPQAVGVYLPPKLLS